MLTFDSIGPDTLGILIIVLHVRTDRRTRVVTLHRQECPHKDAVEAFTTWRKNNPALTRRDIEVHAYWQAHGISIWER